MEVTLIMKEILISSNEVMARRGEYLPSVNLNAGAGVDKVGRFTSQGANDENTEISEGNEFPEPLTDFMLSADVSWELDVWRKLRNAKIDSYFEHVIDSEMAGVKKPNPIIFELALSKANIAPENALMIGDSIEADILGAKALGVHTLHFNAHDEPFHQHCPIIQDLSEIKNFL